MRPRRQLRRIAAYDREIPDIVEETMGKSNNRMLNELLVNLFHNVMDAEAKAVISFSRPEKLLYCSSAFFRARTRVMIFSRSSPASFFSS